MRKIIFLLINLVLVMNIFSMTVFAAIPAQETYTSVEMKSNLCDKNVKSSKGFAKTVTKGEFFASADITISDQGNGNIGAIAHAYLRKPIKELYISIYLDRYNEKEDAWENVDGYDYEYIEKDYPNGIVDPSVSLTFKNQKKGYYYRLRAVFSAADDNKFEGFSPVTDGIWIE